MNPVPRPLLVAFLTAAAAWACSVVQGPSAAQVVQPAAGAAHGVAFDTSGDCLACHNGLVTPAGEDVSIGIAWRASMMAHSARDPYWQAAVRREVLDHPTKQAEIEDECAICHMPMARASARAVGRRGAVFALLPSAPGDGPEHRLAADGVSCTLCHQIGPERLGTRESFVGGFAIAAHEDGERRMFGPFEIEPGLTSVMHSATGVRPAEAMHIRSSEVCATCHTLYTEAFDAAGRVVGSLPEQVPYLEWRHSAFAGERSCQGCHMPEVASTPIASVLGEPRERLSQHTFLGGNFFMLRMLNRYRNELGVDAPSPELDAAARATLRLLETETATVAIEGANVRDGRLDADIVVRNLTGHKLPTGYPSRRAWIDLAVRDARGRVVFQSGAVAPSGAIEGNDNDEDARRFEPHYERIDAPDEVQIYESIIADGEGRVTTGLLNATQFVKDNRVLPRGFDKATAIADIAVQGAATADADFTGDGDRVRYAVPVDAAAGPFRIDVALRYQPIGFRWADNLRSYDAAEPRRFTAYYDAMAAASSAVLARATAVAR